jgi:hypothetical protein
MNIKPYGYWILFAGVQAAGFVALSFANVHSNMAPFFTGIALLLPGSLVLLFSFDFDLALLGSIVLALNFVTWWALRRWGNLEWK